MEKNNHILVVDDRREDGEAIIRRLWKDQLSALFHHFDNGNPLAPEDIDDKHSGIRVVFQDIHLTIGKGTPSHQDYAAAWGVLESLLSKDNGPWLMVAWSTWAEDPDNGDRYARELFEYLQKRLSDGKKPYSYVVLDKQPYTNDGDHGIVKQEDELSEPEKLGLLESVRTELSKVPALSILSVWESDIKKCASSIVNNLWGLVGPEEGQTLEDREARLLQLLYKLGKSQDGRLGVSDDISTPLYELLATLLSDRLTVLPIRQIKHAFTKEDPSIDACLINTMLHWEGSVSQQQMPGVVLSYPDDIVDVDMIKFSSDKRKRGFILDQFLSKSNQEHVRGDVEFFKNISLVILDITPPCDHANRKAGWRRYIVGLKVDYRYQGCLYDENRLANDALRSTPVFYCNDERFFMIFNSRLLCSIPDQVKRFNNISMIGRVKEQLLRDVVNWNGSMATRPGIVSV